MRSSSFLPQEINLSRKIRDIRLIVVQLKQALLLEEKAHRAFIDMDSDKAMIFRENQRSVLHRAVCIERRL